VKDFFLVWADLIVLLIFSAWVAFKKDASLRKKYPEVKPFAWGYFVGMAGTLAGAALGIRELLAAPELYGRPPDFCVVIAWVLFACIHLLMVLRMKWAWVVGIVLHVNPILWMVNGLYLARRWDEMSEMPGGVVGERLAKASLAKRALVAGSMFWALLVFVFVIFLNRTVPTLIRMTACRL
jgi:hypothetical protein